MTGTMQCWPLFGVGLDNLGCDRKPCDWPIPQPNGGQLLVRIDAIGLCFSDIKLIRAGEDHPRVISEDLKSDPVIPGHEAVMTVVEVGEQLRGQFAPGQRYIIQADIYVNGVGLAYGYAIHGGMAEYSLIDERVLNGDEGCYLLPIQPDTPAGIAALIEPWTCVLASYMIEHRTAPAAGGRMLVVGENEDHQAYICEGLASTECPAVIHAMNVSSRTAEALAGAFPNAEVQALEEIPAESSYDDIVLCGLRKRERIEELSARCAANGLVSLVGEGYDGKLAVDVGSVHYKGWFFQGTGGANIAEAYGRNVRSTLRKGGACWLVGGAGAMGQMHTQLAVEDANGPGRVLVTDLDSHRIEKMNGLLAPAIAQRGIEYQSMNPNDFSSPEGFYRAVREFAPDGFDDIVMLVPVVPVLNDAAPLLKTDGLMNIFAGIPAGKKALLDAGAIQRDGVRFVGSSGSRTAHLRKTLELAESGRINPATALAAVGGMKALWEGLDGVANARFAGKTVIFPHCPDLPLVDMERSGEALPGFEKTLSDRGLYTMDSEKALLDEFGARPCPERGRRSF